MVFDYSKLRGRIRERFKTQDALATAIGMSSTTLSNKLNNHVDFSQVEIKRAAEALEIPPKQIPEYFFNHIVQKTEQEA